MTGRHLSINDVIYFKYIPNAPRAIKARVVGTLDEYGDCRIELLENWDESGYQKGAIVWLFSNYILVDPAENVLTFKFFVTAKGFEQTFIDQNEAVTFARGMYAALDTIATNYEYEAGSVTVTKVYDGPAPERIDF